MPDLTVHRDVAAPAETVWSLVSDVTRMGEWSPEATGATWKTASGPSVGARFTGKNRIGRRSWSTSCKVVECDPGRRFAFEVTSGPLGVATWRYRIEPTDGGCRVEESWTDDRGTIVRALGRLVTGVADRADHNRAGMEQTLAALARAAEASGASAG